MKHADKNRRNTTSALAEALQQNFPYECSMRKKHLLNFFRFLNRLLKCRAHREDISIKLQLRVDVRAIFYVLHFFKPLGASREMINVVDKYFNLNRILLLTVGLWPYEKSKYVQLQLICVYSILISGIIFQLTTMLTSKCTAEFIIKILSPSIGSSGLVIKYNAFYVNSKTVKFLMEQVQHIYNDLRDNNEIAIVEKYGNIAKHYTTGLTMVFLFGLFIFVSIQLWPNFTYIILPANTSRSHHSPITMEYFVDQKKYFYLPLFHINATMVIGCFVVISTGSMLIAYLQHACGMFEIASYRIERAIQICISNNIKVQNEILAYKGIIHAVDIHRKAITFSSYLISKFEISFMSLIAVGVLALSLSSFRVFQIVLFGYNSEEFLVNLVIALMCFIYMFLANYIGQQIIDHNNHVFATAYKVRWYVTPLHIQRLILLLLQRGNKRFGLCVGGLFIASIECFATLTNAAVSYSALMYSMR